MALNCGRIVGSDEDLEGWELALEGIELGEESCFGIGRELVAGRVEENKSWVASYSGAVTDAQERGNDGHA